jgi:hypothetical protein
MIAFTTQSGSKYEVDTDNKRIRRLTGKNEPTRRQGVDGNWRNYDTIVPELITIGEQVAIFWTKDTPLLDETPEEDRKIAVPTTITSAVVEMTNA